MDAEDDTRNGTKIDAEDDSRNGTKIDAEDDIRRMLICLIEGHPVLYDPSLKEYQNRVAKDKAWAKIANEMSMEISAVKSLWKIIRNYANSHRERLKLPSGSAAPSDKGHKPWEYTTEIQFLLPFLGQSRIASSSLRGPSTLGSATSPTPSTIGASDIVAEAIETAELQEAVQTPNMGRTPTSRKQRNQASTSVPSKIDQYIDLMLNNREEAPEHPEMGWFRSLLSQIDLLQPLDLLNFKTEVQTLLAKYITKPTQYYRATSSTYQPSPTMSSTYQPLPTMSSTYQPLPTMSSTYQPLPTMSSTHRPLPNGDTYQLPPNVDTYQLSPNIQPPASIDSNGSSYMSL
ncbi:unnamed protein product [Cyprideis torosa]|uniref:Uncharacterized protein n=1 Tax=Cyprideis torosa TaxID=163714 RepID=A0A7R8W9C4_9CRUS|nr:unnamed protein product [Cyprideis torosa]CAG0889652.1 unnamed protein product [Cyprideis torosa]